MCEGVDFAIFARLVEPHTGVGAVYIYAYRIYTAYIRRRPSRELRVSCCLVYIFRGGRKGWMCNEWGLTVAEIHATYHTTHFSYTNIAIYVATYILIFVYHT